VPETASPSLVEGALEFESLEEDEKQPVRPIVTPVSRVADRRRDFGDIVTPYYIFMNPRKVFISFPNERD
jgi:hypothetical protein